MKVKTPNITPWPVSNQPPTPGSINIIVSPFEQKYKN